MRTGYIYRPLATFLLSGTLLLAQSSTNSQPTQKATAGDLVKAGQKLNSEGNQDQALALYRQALQLSPNLFEAHLGTGVALDLKGDYEEARQHLGKAIELAPPEAKVQALRTMAISYAFESNASQAAKFEQQAFDAQNAKQDFEGAAGTADELARIYLESGDLDAAYKWYQTGHATALRKPNTTQAEKDLWNFRLEHAQARIAARRGQSQEAQEHIAAAKAILDKGSNPDQARFYPYLAGYVALYLGDYGTAIANLAKADQRDPFILSLLAQAYEKSGDNAQAMEYYRKVLKLNTHNPTNAVARPLAKKKLGSA
jgi:tetratricopeptide (TPR) repeat protein